MVFCDPTYGMLIVMAGKVSLKISSVFDAEAMFVLAGLAVAVTLLAALASAAITLFMDVDEFSSMKLSRSVQNTRQQISVRRRSSFMALLTQVLEDGTDARFAAGGGLAARELLPRPPVIDEADIAGGSDDDDGLVDDGDQAAGPGRVVHSNYSRLRAGEPQTVETYDADDYVDYAFDLDVERALTRKISRSICISVLLYDVLGLVVCFLWGGLTVRCYSVVLGRLAGLHTVLYLLSCLGYAFVVVVALSRAVFLFAPSSEEITIRDRVACKVELASAPMEIEIL